MKITYFALAVMMGINIFTVVLMSVDVVPIQMTPFNISDAGEKYNATEVIGSIDLEQQDFYTIGTALQIFWNIHIPLIESFPGMVKSMANQMGTGSEFADGLTLMWRFTWVGWVISVLMGRDFMP